MPQIPGEKSQQPIGGKHFNKCWRYESNPNMALHEIGLRGLEVVLPDGEIVQN